MLNYTTGGESHGRCLVAILEGMVAGVPLDIERMNLELRRRQLGYGRGGRMTIETDTIELLSGERFGETIGSPLTVRIHNNDFKINELPVVHRPRPGHADLVGAMKYARKDVRDVLERASARETAARVAIGAICKEFLRNFGVEVMSHVVDIGGVKAPETRMTFDEIKEKAEKSEVRCFDAQTSKLMIQCIDAIKKQKDTVGGVFEIRTKGVPPGLGTYSHYSGRLDARLSFALMSIQAVKGVEVGLGFGYAHTPGSSAHDEIYYNDDKKAFTRKTNHAGGIEGSMSNGEEIILRAVAKPYATLMKPMVSANIVTKKKEVGTIERSDVTAVPACGVVGEAMVAFEIAKIYLEKFGGDSLVETLRNYKGYLKQVEKF